MAFLTQMKFKCSHCKKETTSTEMSDIKCLEIECDHCGEWFYWKKPKDKPMQLKKEKTVNVKQEVIFKKGMEVRKNLYFNGKLTEYSKQKIHSISKGVIYLSDSEGRKETGVTYNLDGSEVENMFPQFTSKIILLKNTKK